jgi:hypothetical protein
MPKAPADSYEALLNRICGRAISGKATRKALMKNPAVSQIDIVDPKYGNSKTIFKR